MTSFVSCLCFDQIESSPALGSPGTLQVADPAHIHRTLHMGVCSIQDPGISIRHHQQGCDCITKRWLGVLFRGGDNPQITQPRPITLTAPATIVPMSALICS